MGSMSIWHWLVVFMFYILMCGIPAWKIVSKSGHSGAWSLLALLPVIGTIALWVFAFKRWPAMPTKL